MSRPKTGVLHGRHAVVTGGGRGLGAAISTALAAEGADMTLMGRTRATIETHAAALQQTSGVQARAIVCDVSDPQAVASAFADATANLGPVRILVNNAGISEAAPSEEVSLDSWNRLLAVNLTGTFLCIQQVLPAMIAARAGRVVNVASVAGLKGFASVAGYCASKHGVVGLTRALAVETARSGITVNAVCPGYTDGTDMFRMAVANVMRAKGQSEDEALATLARNSRRGTLITPQEVADAVVWLCSPGAGAMTGQAIAVAAGEVM
jgi:NAD(P)-dependent dehydrogenase (short-subunit alcohol dehydrogenase family)